MIKYLALELNVDMEYGVLDVNNDDDQMRTSNLDQVEFSCLLERAAAQKWHATNQTSNLRQVNVKVEVALESFQRHELDMPKIATLQEASEIYSSRLVHDQNRASS